MGNTYKDREKKGLPRVPKWARPRPERIHRTSKKDRAERRQDRDEFLEDLWDGGQDE